MQPFLTVGLAPDHEAGRRPVAVLAFGLAVPFRIAEELAHHIGKPGAAVQRQLAIDLLQPFIDRVAELPGDHLALLWLQVKTGAARGPSGPPALKREGPDVRMLALDDELLVLRKGSEE